MKGGKVEALLLKSGQVILSSPLHINVSERQGNEENLELFFLCCKCQQQSENIVDTLSTNLVSASINEGTGSTMFILRSERYENTKCPLCLS